MMKIKVFRLPLKYTMFAFLFLMISNHVDAQIGTGQDDSGDRFVKYLPNGMTEFITIDELRKIIYKPDVDNPCVAHTDPPTWRSRLPINAEVTGTIYTGMPCPAKIGINTINPSGVLGVASPWLTQDIPVIKGTSYNNKGTALALGSKNNTNPSFWVLGSGQLHIQMSATATDNRAIRVSDPQGNDVFRLLNSGVIYGTEYYALLKGDFPSYPDYVFEEDYELMSIDELSNYIKKHKHLPNMPAAKDLHEQGAVNLAEQTRLQLEKIEELSLYVIELQERIAELEKNQDK